MAFSSNCASILLVSIVVCGLQSCCEAFGTFGFDVHHRYSDPVKGILDLHGLPEKGSIDYFAAMAHRDRLRRGRNLAGTTAAGSTPLTFAGGNDTYQISLFGYLHYANVTVGSPALWFLVALDTGSDLLWLPCDCTSCVHGLKTSGGQVIELNIYSPNTSSTSARVSCNSTFCGQPRQCSSRLNNTCVYQVQYLSNDTSSTGIMVEDVLHLTTDDSQLKVVDARIPFGCGIIETGSFLDGAAPNGLFGLGMNSISVPSVLASQGLTANSFSMCFGPDGIGRISFGDKGSSGQGETPFNLQQSNPTYNISLTQVTVGDNVTNLSFSAVFDSGTSFTSLTDPAYTIISESFNSQAKEKRHPADSSIPFEYCYDLSANQNSFEPPMVNLTMKGGMQFYVTDPIVFLSFQNGGNVYCLAVVQSGDISIIGQNFMTGYNIVFDREDMVLGWEPSNCYDAKNSNTLPINPPKSSAMPPTPKARSGSGNGSPVASMPPTSGSGNGSPVASMPPTSVEPEARPGNGNGSPVASMPPTSGSGNGSPVASMPPTSVEPEARPGSGNGSPVASMPPTSGSGNGSPVASMPPTSGSGNGSPVVSMPPTSVEPEARSGSGNGSPVASEFGSPSTPSSDSPRLSSSISTLVAVMFFFLIQFSTVGSS